MECVLIISDDELAGLEQAATALTSDIKLGKDFARGIQETVHKGLVWKNLSRERKIEEERAKHLRKRKVRLENGEVAGATKALIQVTPQYSEKNQSWFVARVREPIRQLLYGTCHTPRDNIDISSDILDTETCRGNSNIRKFDHLHVAPLTLYFCAFILMFLFISIRF